MNKSKMEKLDKKRMKQFLKIACFYMLFMAIMCNPHLTIWAGSDTSEVDRKFDNLLDLAASVVSSLGTIITLWGISEFGLAMQGNDGMMQSHSFRRIGGGLLMTIAPQVLVILTK